MLSYNKLKRFCPALLLGATTVLSAPAYAVNDAMMDLIKILRDKGSISNSEYQLLRNAAMADAEQVESVKQEVDKKTKGLPKITTDGKFEVKAGDWKWRVGGRLMHDATWWGTDDSINAQYFDGHEFRRARLYASGTMGKNWDFKLQYDFTDTDDSQASVEDAYIRYKGFPVTLTFGQQKAAYSLNEMTSSKYITFIERSLVTNAFSGIVGNRRAGITASHADNGFTLTGGVYLNRSNNDGAPEAIGDGYVFTGRATFAPIREKTRNLHIGASVGYRNLSGNALRVRARPEVHIADRPIDTDGVAGDSVIAYGLEAAGVMGPFSAQFEYMGYDLDGVAGGTDADGDGWYIFGSYFLTGESRNYKWKKGAFDSVKPKSYAGKGGIGAWELAVRYSTADLDDTGVAGGKIDNLTVGLNWYATKNMMWKLNYVNVLDCNATCEDGFATGDADAITIRTQFYW